MKTHSVNIRVTYADTDKMGVVYYSNYFVWFEVARTEFFRREGVVYKDIEKEKGLFLPVVEATARYRLPITYDEIVTVKTHVSETGNSRIVFEYEVKREDGEIAATGTTKHTFVDKNKKPVPIPPDIRPIFGHIS